MARLSQDTLKGANKLRDHTTLRAGEEHHLAPEDEQQNSFAETAPSSLNHSTTPKPNDSCLQPNGADHLYQGNYDELGLSYDLSPSEINDIFDGLTGDLDLSRIDTLFSTNLNPTMPLIPTEWMEF